MDAELKEKWVAALRSGDYPQTRFALNRTKSHDEAPVGFCCLGVLCEVAGLPKEADYDNEFFVTYLMLDSNGEQTECAATLSTEQAKIFGIEEVAPKLMDMNDSVGKNFDEIADWIEQHV